MRIPTELRQTLISAGVVGSFVGVLCALGSFAFYPEYAPSMASDPHGLWEEVLDAIGTFVLVTVGIVIAFGLLPSALSYALSRRLHSAAPPPRSARSKGARRSMAAPAPRRKCGCADLDGVVSCGENAREAFIVPRRLRLLREKRGARLYVCAACSTYWQVDQREWGSQARKIAEPFRWEPVDEPPCPRQPLEHTVSGCAQRHCTSLDCSQHALEDRPLCARHAYLELGNMQP